MPDINPQIKPPSTLDNVILRITKDGIYLEFVGKIAALQIDYSGTLKADFDGRNVVAVSRDKT